MCFIPDPHHPEIIPEMEGYKVCLDDYNGVMGGLFYNQKGLRDEEDMGYKNNIIEQIGSYPVCFFKTMKELNNYYDGTPPSKFTIVRVNTYNARRGFDGETPYNWGRTVWGAEMVEIIDNVKEI